MILRVITSKSSRKPICACVVLVKILKEYSNNTIAKSMKKKANGSLDGWIEKKKAREDDVDSCTAVATAAAQNMECDGNSSSSNSSSSSSTAPTTQRLTEVTAISTDLNSTDDLYGEEDTTSATTAAVGGR